MISYFAVGMTESFGVVARRLQQGSARDKVLWIVDDANFSVEEDLSMQTGKGTRSRLLVFLLWAGRVAPQVVDVLQEEDPRERTGNVPRATWASQ